jgi:hypothetical protein
MNAQAYGSQSATVTSSKRRLFVSMRVTKTDTLKIHIILLVEKLLLQFNNNTFEQVFRATLD